MTTAAIPQTDSQHAAFYDSLPDGYYEADLEGSIVVANRALCEMLGIDDPARLQGNGYRQFVDAENVNRLRRHAQRVLKTGQPLDSAECLVTNANGEQRCFEVSLALKPAPQPGLEHKPAGFHGIVRDVTQTVRGNESVRLYEGLKAELAALKEKYAELSEVEQLKTHMIRVTAHDLRSPLSIISSYIELLDEDLAPHYGELDTMYVSAIRQAVARMLQMTSDILTLERLHEYREVTLIRVPLASLLERTLGEFSEDSRKRRQSVSFSGDPVSTYGDSVELHEAFANLIGNAVKYTPDGGSIQVRLQRDGEFAVVDIIDTGYGIPEDQQANLFQPFQRIKTTETYAIDGTGLGLYLVKKIIERHGGTVLVQSEYGKGSTFTVRLPLAK